MLVANTIMNLAVLGILIQWKSGLFWYNRCAPFTVGDCDALCKTQRVPIVTASQARDNGHFSVI